MVIHQRGKKINNGVTELTHFHIVFIFLNFTEAPRSLPPPRAQRGDSGGCPITPVIIRQLLKATHDPDANAFSLDGKTLAEVG